MRVISKKRLKQFWKREPEAEGQLQAWFAEAEDADWNSPADVKAKYGTANILNDNRVVFNTCGNKYRLIVKITYRYGMVYIRFIGTHAEYDKIDAGTV